MNRRSFLSGLAALGCLAVSPLTVGYTSATLATVETGDSQEKPPH